MNSFTSKLKIKKTEAAILYESHAPLKIAKIELPEELLDFQILVELISSGICGAQINEIDARKGVDKFLPHLLGHEGYGVILQVGPKVTKVKKGDEVVLHWRPSVGKQSVPPKYVWNGKIVNAGWVTTFNRHAVVSENRITKIISGLDSNFIPLLGCSLTTAYGVVNYESNLNSKDNLLLFGFGGVGVAILKFAKINGVKNITVVDLHDQKKELALKAGADYFIPFTGKAKTLNALSAVFGVNGNPNICIDTTGNISAIEICYEISSEIAKIILLGVPKKGEKVSIYTLPLHFGKVLTGTQGGSSEPDRDIPQILALLKAKRIGFNDFATMSYDFSNINVAINDLRKGVLYRPVIKFN